MLPSTEPLAQAVLAASVGVFVAVTLVWLISLWKRDASIVDIFWGLGFVLVAWIARAVGPEAVWRQTLLLALVTLWGVRLGGYIFWRARGHGEDYRYREMRKNHGEAFWWRSYGLVFLLQGALIIVISAPHLLTQTSPMETTPRWSDGLGLLLFAIGFAFEAGGDWQLARFKADPANRGKVLDSGFWAWTRHPNYFGDAVVWWGFFVLALAAPGAWWTLPAPILMNLLLLKVSGVALLEKTIVERRPQYREYIESTSAFIPWPPKKRS